MTEDEKKFKDLELFNAHQEDVRRRADSLAKAIFVLSGGTLTVSIGIFTNKSIPTVSPDILCALKASWWSLFASILFLVITLTTIIARDYMLGERWRKKTKGEDIDASGTPTIIESLIWILAILGLLSFLIGILGQAYVATSVL